MRGEGELFTEFDRAHFHILLYSLGWELNEGVGEMIQTGEMEG